MSDKPNTRIDFVIASRRSLKTIQKLFLEAADAPEVWACHNFIVVYDTPERADELRNWMKEMLDVLPLPRITVCSARPGYSGNLSALRQQGLEQGDNPYIYFQDDDDPLPENLDDCITMFEEEPYDAVYGIAEYVKERGQSIETQPQTFSGRFITSPRRATRYMPTYVHPLAALFKRSLFSIVPMDNGKRYNTGGGYAFVQRLSQSHAHVGYTANIIRTCLLHNDNNKLILNAREQKELSQDILSWQDDIQDDDIRLFQRDIAHALNAGSISTLREIAAQVDLQLEESN